MSATTGDAVYQFPVNGNVQSLSLHKHFLAVGVVEEATVSVYNVLEKKEVLCLPSIHGGVNSVHLDEDALLFGSGNHASMYGGKGDFSWQQVPDYYVIAALVHGEEQITTRCLSSIQRRHPEIVNCRHPKRGGTFLQYAMSQVTSTCERAYKV